MGFNSKFDTCLNEKYIPTFSDLKISSKSSKNSTKNSSTVILNVNKKDDKEMVSEKNWLKKYCR